MKDSTHQVADGSRSRTGRSKSSKVQIKKLPRPEDLQRLKKAIEEAK